ncbi:MAG: amidohydrolase family protein [Nitrospirota bacterium]|nr:amidohydrolase family protein [Nitrospirota bacterium]
MTDFKNIIDLHTHGIGRYDTRLGSPEHIVRMAALHAKRGTGAILPTIYPDSIDVMRKNMEAVRKAIALQKSQKGVSARILGAHLEGPFLNPAKCGALEDKAFIRPMLSSLTRLIDGYEDIIRIITIAPEIPGALKVIERCAELGLKVNMGHSDATIKQAVEGKKAGATGITHLFNAMRPFHHREPGLAGLGILDEELYTEVIADGVHLHPKTLELIFSRKRLDRIILVSDSVKGAGSGKGAIYKKDGTLSGSATTIAGGVKILRSAGIPDADIIMASTDNPARYIGLR